MTLVGSCSDASGIISNTTAYSGLATGMKIAPCPAFPTGATVTDIAVDGLNFTVTPASSEEVWKYTFTVYEPSAGGSAIVYFQAMAVSSAVLSAVLLTSRVVLVEAVASSETSASASLTGANVSLQAAPSASMSATAALIASKDVSLQSAASTVLSATASVTGCVAALNGVAITETSSIAVLTGGNQALQGVTISGMSATATLIGGNQALQAATITESSATATLGGATALLSATPKTETAFTADVTGASDIRTRSVCSLIQESLSLWGFLCSKTAPPFAKARALTDLNTALQLVWSNADGHDYWTNETLTITLADTEDSYDLLDSIQNVKGPCRRDDTKQPLAAIGSISEFESFVDLYLDGDEAAGPVAYHIETMKQAGEEPAKTVFRITPAVSGASVSFLLDVVKEAPRYTTSDLVSCPAVPIPHRYAETLLIPIIRYNASSYYLFEALDPKQKETIDREYQQARQQLGLGDPNPVKETPASKKEA